MNRDAVGFRERIGNHFILFAIKTNMLGSCITQMFNVRARFRKRGRFKIAKTHNNVIVVSR